MRRAVVSLLVLLALGAAAGCDTAGTPTESPTDAETVAAVSARDSAELLVLGRSVMTGWMAHWGGDVGTPAEWQGYTVTLREIEGPPAIAATATSAISGMPVGSVVLFKFCFVDFDGGDYTRQVDEYLGYVAEVADAAAAGGVSLILGTALPKVSGDTTPELVAEHREFARRIEELASDRRADGQDVVVLDMNAILADADGALRDGYAVSDDDSHLNEAAYEALDEALLRLLDERR